MKYKVTIVKDIKEEIEIEAFDEEHAQQIAIEKIERDKEYEKIVAYYVNKIEKEKQCQK
jgi:hypothetical protein